MRNKKFGILIKFYFSSNMKRGFEGKENIRKDIKYVKKR
jgi:hypothetical protein